MLMIDVIFTRGSGSAVLDPATVVEPLSVEHD